MEIRTHAIVRIHRRRVLAAFRTGMILMCVILIGALGARATESEADGLVFTGRYRLRVQANSVVGSVQQYRLDTGLYPGSRLSQGVALSGFGVLGGGWSFDGRYDDALSMPERLEIRIHKAANELFAGTRRFMSPSSGLLQWGRLLTGVQVSALTPGGQFGLRAAVGDPLGIPAREELPGRGLVGPYLLASYHLPVVPDSEVVYIDGMLQHRGTDYDIDYELGGITFREPIPESSRIVIEYEYQAPQPRRTSVALGRWKEDGITFDILAGEEHATGDQEEPPLVFVPPDGQEDTLPAKQHMYGAALSWVLSPTFAMSGSWLATRNELWGDETRAAAWQVGGQWQDTSGKAGWDYRVIPKDYQPIGRPGNSSGFRELSAGYEYRLTGPWYSKVNVAWRQGLASQVAEVLPSQSLAEHVLTYAQGNSTLGWSLGLVGHRQPTGQSQQVTTGLLGTTQLGAWHLEAERRSVLDRIGSAQPGDMVASTRLAADVTAHPTLSGGVQWKQDNHLVSTNELEQVTLWRMTLASKNQNRSTYSLLSGTPSASWRLHWLQSSSQQRILGESEGVPQRLSQLRYGRAEATTPLWQPGLSATGLTEVRTRTGYGDDTTDRYIKVGVQYNKTLRWDLYTSAQQVITGYQQPVRLQQATGGELVLPLGAGWNYSGSLQVFRERDAGTLLSGIRRIQGVEWGNLAWRLGVDWTEGLLDDPMQPGEDSKKKLPLSQLPVGKRFGIKAERYSTHTRLSAQIARDIERAASGWKGDVQAEVRVGSNQLSAWFRSTERRGEAIWSLRQSGKLSVQWAVGPQSSFSIQGRSDIRASHDRSGDYLATGVFAEWTTRF